MRLRRWVRLGASARGAQILELAVALPLLVVFVVGIYDFSRAFNTKEKLNFAARDGARFGSTQPTNDLSQSTPLSVTAIRRSEEHTSELQSHLNLVCRLLLEKKKIHA